MHDLYAAIDAVENRHIDNTRHVVAQSLEGEDEAPIAQLGVGKWHVGPPGGRKVGDQFADLHTVHPGSAQRDHLPRLRLFLHIEDEHITGAEFSEGLSKRDFVAAVDIALRLPAFGLESLMCMRVHCPAPFGGAR